MHTPTQSIVFVRLSLSLSLSHSIRFKSPGELPQKDLPLWRQILRSRPNTDHTHCSLSLSLCHDAAARQPSGLCWGECQCATRPIPERAPRWQPRHPFVPDRPRCQTARPPRASHLAVRLLRAAAPCARSRFDVFIDVCIPSMPSHLFCLGPLSHRVGIQKKKGGRAFNGVWRVEIRCNRR